MAITLAVWGSVSEEYDPGFGAATALFATGGPVVHALHRHPVRALASAGLRVGLPAACMFLGAGIAVSQSPATDEGCLALGILGAMIADDGLLAWDDDGSRGRGPSSSVPRPVFAPATVVMRDGGRLRGSTLGLAAEF